MTVEKLSRTRLWTFRLIALLVVPMIFLFALEGGLRLFGMGHDAGFTTACEVNGQPYLCENTRFIERFFPADIARQPVPFAYPQNKPADTFRIFVLGASAAQGDPESSYGFSRILRLMLEKAYPALDFEIINTAISATNSHVVLPIAKEVSRHQPDLAIVYLGNNEVVGPFGAGTIFAPIAGNLGLVRAGIALKATRLGQLLDRARTGLVGRETPGEWRGMEMFIDNQVRHDAPELQTVYSHYQDNLADIIQFFSGQQTPVILSTVGSNLKDFPPLESQLDPTLSAAQRKSWSGFYARGKELLETGQAEQALAAFRQAQALDADHAELNYLLGRCYLALPDLTTAKEYFVRARDLDTLRFRADSRINAIVRDVAKRFADEGVELVDAVELFNQQSPADIAGNELFHEHVHLNFAGNYHLARKMAAQVREVLAQTKPVLEPRAGLLSEQEAAELLALGAFDRLRLRELILSRMTSPPFTGQFGAQQRIERLEGEYARLQQSLTPAALERTDGLYRRALRASPQDPTLMLNYGVFLREQGNPAAALRQFKAAEALLPRSYKVHRHLSEVYVALGRWEDSLPHFQASLDLTRSTKDRTGIRIMKAYAQARLERYSASMATYRNALDEDPSAAADIYHAMAMLKISTGEWGEARTFLEKGIAQHEEGEAAADMYFNYGYTLAQLDREKPAKEAYRKALNIYQQKLEAVSDASARESLLVVLGRSAFAAGDIDQGKAYLEEAIALNPLDLSHHLTLLSSLSRHGRSEAVRNSLAQAKQRMREAGQIGNLLRLQRFEAQLNQQKN